ncbi:helix-turn-helix domain-containing protein [Larkinella sp. C7]|jgi:ATP-dependent DNA helicase RecG|uniref:AlbA family DNA-binding domain-containing protein n=1 Tax=Larkinella sp. C7 TaxID=2576607 RepID=UPI00111136E5|nr:RNA-binding domain-containing protein [Larkinella sp. C7]
MLNVKDLLERLNSFDECSYLEAKSGTQIDRSILETVCAFSNEPSLGGGYILLGVQRDESELFPTYRPISLSDPDKLQRDLATSCASMFNIAIRPEIRIERLQGYALLNVFVPELSPAQKPLFFKNKKLPEGAYRRIGSTDQACVEDDMVLFYNHAETYDSSPLTQTSFADVDIEALDLYRKLRTEVNPAAEELTLDDEELLLALGCAVREKEKYNYNYKLTVAGLVLFGKDG